MGYILVPNADQIFTIAALGSLGEIVGPCNRGLEVDFVVHDLVLAIVADADAMLTESMPLSTAGSPLSAVQYHLHRGASLSGRDQGVRNGGASQGVGGHIYRGLRGVEGLDQHIVAVLAGGETYGDRGGGRRERSRARRESKGQHDNGGNGKKHSGTHGLKANKYNIYRK